MSGHAFARGLRTHFLTQLSLALIFLQNIEIADDETAQFTSLHDDIMNNTQLSDNVSTCPILGHRPPVSNLECGVLSECHLFHLTILRNFSCPSLAYRCTKVAQGIIY